MQSFLQAVSSAWAVIGHLSKPSACHIKDKQQYELAHTRNKSLVGLHIFAFTQFFLNLLFGNGEKAPNIHGMIGTSGIIAVLFITSHYRMHPQVFKILFNIYVLTFAVLLIGHNEHGIFGAWLAVPIYPIQLYFLTGSLGHFVINISCHTILMNTYYQDLMKSSLAYMSLDETMKALTHFSNQSMSYSLLYTAFSHLTIQSAVYKIQTTEKQREDLERQRNFLLGFSHELRNLINSLMGNVKLASLEILSGKAKDLLVNAEVCSELLLHLVNNILDTGKVEIGDLEINPVPTKVYDTIERIWSVCSELIKTKNLNGQLKIKKDIPPILIMDHYRITQIFLNLIGNAVKFTDSGHVNITVEWINNKKEVDEKCFEPIPFNDDNDQDEGLFEKTQALSVFNMNFAFLNSVKKSLNRRQLIENISSQKGILKVSVSDTGSGIIKEDLSNIFQRFQQGNTDPSKKKLGTGLGLFITRELCEKMGGQVRVFSKPKFGSTFTFCLPVEPGKDERAHMLLSDSERLPRNIDQHHHNQSKLTAIVVDDDKFSQQILGEFLQKLNVEIASFADNGLEGYQRYAENNSREGGCVNIITMDINMDVMNGKIAAKKIRELEVQKNLEPCLLIMVSGNCGEAEIAECLNKNGRIRANAFVKKPVSVDELSRIITSYSTRMQLRHCTRLRTV